MAEPGPEFERLAKTCRRCGQVAQTLGSRCPYCDEPYRGRKTLGDRLGLDFLDDDLFLGLAVKMAFVVPLVLLALLVRAWLS
jgi:hypothetical protein